MGNDEKKLGTTDLQYIIIAFDGYLYLKVLHGFSS